jgi:hypothetical protein
MRSNIFGSQITTTQSGSSLPVSNIGIGAFRWPSEGKEIANISIAWRASVGQLDWYLENGVNVSDPVLPAWGGEFQLVLQGNRFTLLLESVWNRP